MAIYNQNLYNTFLYKDTGQQPVATATVDQVDQPVSPDVDRWISPYFKRFFPEFWASEYPDFLQLFRYFLEFLENENGSYWNAAHTVELASISTTIDANLNNMREQFSPDFRFEDFPNIDKRKFLENSKRYFSIKGNDQSFKFLFRMLGHEIDIFNPLDDTLFLSEHSTIGDQKLIDSFYFNPYSYDIRTDLPYNKWNDFIRRMNHPIGTHMFGTFLVLLGNQLIKVPTFNTTIPNKPDAMIRLINDIENQDTPVIEVTGDISDFPDPTDPTSENRLIIRVGSEDMLYSAKDDTAKTFTISERAVNDTRQVSHEDVAQFTVNIDNDYIVLNQRLDYQSGKTLIFSSTEELPTPLEPNTTYYATLLEIQSRVEGEVGAGDTQMVLEDGSMFPSTAIIYVNGEFIEYESLNGNTLNNLQRGQMQSTARSHSDEDKVYVWTRTLRLSETCDDVFDKVYINLTDNGTGTHTITGPGQEITLFTGFTIARPQALVVRELLAYTTFDQIERDIFVERVIHVDYKSIVTVVIGTNTFTTIAGNHLFSFGEQVKFESPTTGLTADINNSDTTIPVEDTSMYNSTGMILIENEWMSYTGKTATSFTGVTRGALSTTPVDHTIHSNVTSRGYETTDNIELNGIYRVSRVNTGSGVQDNQFRLIDDDDNVIDITANASATFSVVLHDFNNGTMWRNENVVTQSSTSSTGTISWPDPNIRRGRTLYIDPTITANNWSVDGSITIADLDGTGVATDVEIINTIGDYTLTECDFNGLTFDQVETGGDNYPQVMKTKFSMIREESAIDITRRYFIPDLTIDVQTEDPNWVPTTDTFASFNPLNRGHISMANSTLQGLLRGFVAPNRPVVEVDPSTNLNAERDSLGRVTATIGTSVINGDFSSPPVPLNTDITIELAGVYYRWVSGTSTAITVNTGISVDGLSAGDTYIGEAFVSNAIWSGDGSGSTSTRRHWQDENFGYALGLGPTKNYIRLTLGEQVANSENWRSTSDTSFNAISQGHITQLVTNATGIIRAKNTVETSLNGAISDVDTTITVDDASQFPDSGRVLIEDEFITYASKSATQLLGVVRGTHNTSAILHVDGSIVISANISEAEPSTVIVEVISGTFNTQATNTVSVGNGSASGNDIRVVNSIEDRTKGLPSVGQLMYNNPVLSTDPNGLRTWQILEVHQTNDETVVVLDQPYTEPTDPGNNNGTANLVNTSKEYN